MKKYKKLLFLFLLSLCLILLCSCRCNPAEYQWYLSGLTEDVTFSNGITEKVSISGSVDIYQPYAVDYAERCLIEFSNDGRVTMNLDGEELSGTYTYKHNGFADTGFTVTLDNGESFFGTLVSFYGGRELRFEFRGTSYEFTDRFGHSVTKEDAEQHTEYLIEDLRDLEAGRPNGRFDNYLGEITLSGDDFILTSAGEEYNLSSGGNLVWCSLLNEKNQLSHLKKIELGECYFAINNYLPIRESGQQKIARAIIIYYIEPLPEEPSDLKPEKKALAELYPWILGDVSSIKLTQEWKNLPAGYTKYHDYLTADEILICLDGLRSAELCEIYSEDLENYFLNGDMYKVLTLYAEVGDGKQEIQFVDGLIFDGEKWWKPDYMPEFSYDGALQSFIVYNDTVHVFNREGSELGSFSDMLSAIEFEICKEEHNYTSLMERFTLVTEFGEITVYDSEHFWYKGQSYVAVGENNFAFLFCEDK